MKIDDAEREYEDRKRKAICESIGLTPSEFNAWVTGVYGRSSGYGYSVYFHPNMPDSIRAKVPDLKTQLFLHTGPVTFDEG